MILKTHIMILVVIYWRLNCSSQWADASSPRSEDLLPSSGDATDRSRPAPSADSQSSFWNIVMNTILHLYILHTGPLRRRIRTRAHIVISPTVPIMQLNCQQFASMLQFAGILTFVGELGHPVQISQRWWPVLVFIINQQVHLRLRQELGHSPSAPTGSFFGRRRQLLAVLVFVLHDGREDGCRSGETSLHGVVHSVEPGPGARVRLHASSRKLQLLVETESSADRPQRDLILLSTLPPAPTPVIQNSQEPRCFSTTSSLCVDGGSRHPEILSAVS